MSMANNSFVNEETHLKDIAGNDTSIFIIENRGMSQNREQRGRFKSISKLKCYNYQKFQHMKKDFKL